MVKDAFVVVDHDEMVSLTKRDFLCLCHSFVQNFGIREVFVIDGLKVIYENPERIDWTATNIAKCEELVRLREFFDNWDILNERERSN